MKNINSKALIGLITVFIIFAVFVMISFKTDKSNEEFMQELSFHQKIDEQQIESINMSEVIMVNSTNKQFDVELTNEQCTKIVSRFNSVPFKSIRIVKTIDSSIDSGIAIRLKDGTEIKIEYDKNNIYVTRPEVKHIRNEVIYIIDDNELKEIFDNELKKVRFKL